MDDCKLVIPRNGEFGPELYVMADGAEHIIPLRPGMVANLLDFCTKVAGEALRKGRPGT